MWQPEVIERLLHPGVGAAPLGGREAVTDLKGSVTHRSDFDVAQLDLGLLPNQAPTEVLNISRSKRADVLIIRTLWLPVGLANGRLPPCTTVVK